MRPVHMPAAQSGAEDGRQEVLNKKKKKKKRGNEAAERNTSHFCYTCHNSRQQYVTEQRRVGRCDD